MACKKKVTLSDESVNSYGFRLLMSGCDDEQFKKNPVMLYGHDDSRPPIGMWDGYSRNGALMDADTNFDENDPFAMTISNKVENGYLKMASIGLSIIELSDDPALKLQGQTGPTVTKWKLREASIVPMGANQNAFVQLYDADGAKIEMNDKTIARLFEGAKPNITDNKMKTVALKLNLAENADEAAILAAVVNLQAQVTKLETEKNGLETKLTESKDALKAFQEADKTAFLADAITTKKIGADEKETWANLYDANPAAAKAAMAKLSGVPDVQGAIGAGGNFELSDEQKKWSFRDWDKAEKTALLKEKNPELYKQLFKDEYGVEPK